MIHLDEMELLRDQTGATDVRGDVFFQTYQGIGIVVDDAGSADESAIAIADTEDGDFFTVQAEAHEGAEKGIHAGRVAATKEHGDWLRRIGGDHEFGGALP